MLVQPSDRNGLGRSAPQKGSLFTADREAARVAAPAAHSI
jgi:hypothetical protein